MKEERSSFGRNLSYLLIGGGIGAILALLFAPKAGDEFRKTIADAARSGMDKTGELAADLGETVHTAFDNATAKAGETYQYIKEKMTDAAFANDGERPAASEVVVTGEH